MRGLNSYKRSLGLAFVLALIGSIMAAIPASAIQSSGGQASTSANVGGAGNAPNIECAWVLHDYDGDWGNDMQYGQDDDSTKATADKCDAADTVSPASQASGAANLIQVKPNAHDEPTTQWIELWAAVDEANPGNTIVVFDVYHPDGSRKVNLPATRLERNNLKSCFLPPGMSDAARTTGQLTTTAVAAMDWECKNQTKAFFYGAFDLSKHQPYGEYRVAVHAETIGGGVATHDVYFDVLPFVQLEKDFDQVTFGSITANSHFQSKPGGDFTWSPVNQGGTTIRNTGNAGMNLNVTFDPMCLVGYNAAETALNCQDSVKRIDRFDVKFGTPAGLQSFGDTEQTAVPAGTTVYFDNAPNTTLCPNELGKIEFSIWTGVILGGEYVGVPTGIHLGATGSGNNDKCPTDRGAPDPGYETAAKTSGYWNVTT